MSSSASPGEARACAEGLTSPLNYLKAVAGVGGEGGVARDKEGARGKRRGVASRFLQVKSGHEGRKMNIYKAIKSKISSRVKDDAGRWFYYSVARRGGGRGGAEEGEAETGRDKDRMCGEWK